VLITLLEEGGVCNICEQRYLYRERMKQRLPRLERRQGVQGVGTRAQATFEVRMTRTSNCQYNIRREEQYVQWIVHVGRSGGGLGYALGNFDHGCIFFFLGCNFLRFMYTKVTQRSYGYFVKFSFFGFWRKWFLHLFQKLQSLIKKRKEF
jgi:hypothetical protein